jgi:RimJ/RimL family protein N-acetyltransferase
VTELRGAWEIAATTLSIPHPYEESMAQAWIQGHQEALTEGKAMFWAITRRDDSQLVGGVGLHFSKPHHAADIGYWIGTPYWNQGYATEAAAAVIRYGFAELDLNRIQGKHMTKNPASGRVMAKVGMQFEGILRQAIYRWDRFEDIAVYAILRQDVAASSKEDHHGG